LPNDIVSFAVMKYGQMTKEKETTDDINTITYKDVAQLITHMIIQSMMYMVPSNNFLPT